jgi:CRP/FNR family nitrogen fixation transcriptional regulator
MTAQLAIDSAQSLDADPVAGRDLGELSFIGIARSLSRDQEVYGQGDRTDFAYKVASGAVRATRLLADGRRQITDFYLPGDVFGIELGAAHSSAAEAICDTVVVSARRSSLGEDQDQRSRLWLHTMRALQRSQAHLLTLGRRTAIERIAIFLVDLADRIGATDQMLAPMSRLDIADYLGLTIETVSRTLTLMQTKGLLAIENGRQLRLLKRARLAELCE